MGEFAVLPQRIQISVGSVANRALEGMLVGHVLHQVLLAVKVILAKLALDGLTLAIGIPLKKKRR